MVSICITTKVSNPTKCLNVYCNLSCFHLWYLFLLFTIWDLFIFFYVWTTLFFFCVKYYNESWSFQYIICVIYRLLLVTLRFNTCLGSFLALLIFTIKKQNVEVAVPLMYTWETLVGLTSLCDIDCFFDIEQYFITNAWYDILYQGQWKVHGSFIAIVNVSSFIEIVEVSLINLFVIKCFLWRKISLRGSRSRNT